VCKFSLATTTRYKGNESTEWHNLVAWGKLAETIAKFLAKGQQAIFHGRLTYNSWEKDGIKRTTAEVVVETMEFVGSAREQRQKPVEEAEMDIPF